MTREGAARPAAAGAGRGASGSHATATATATTGTGTGTGTAAMLVVAIMFLGSLGLWVGTPLLWLWVGGHVQGATNSLGTALAVAFAGVVATATALAVVLTRLSEVHRGNCVARGLADPGNVMLEGVLVVSAGLTVAAFLVWFFFLAGTSPVPIGIHV